MLQTRYIIYCGAGAAVGAVAAIMTLAKAEGKPALAPVNASSHWLWGDKAGRQTEADLEHTGIGGATNICAGLMWGGLLGAHFQRRRPTSVGIVRDGAVMGAIAGLLDYGLLPRRLSPGWELVLSGRSVVLGMASMAAGAVIGGFAARAHEDAKEWPSLRRLRSVGARTLGVDTPFGQFRRGATGTFGKK